MNNYVGNLEWVTREENAQHAVRIGLIKSGEENYKAKFTSEQVKYIRDNSDNLTCTQFAEKFSVDLMTISLIQRGKTYKNAGGTIRKKKNGGFQPVSDNIRAQIRAEYQKGVRGCDCHALAKKYGVDHSTILKIVNSH